MLDCTKKLCQYLSLCFAMTGCPSGGGSGAANTNSTPTPSPTATPTPTATPVSNYCGGMGTEFFPYLICDQRSLQNISINLNSHFRLNSNITISGIFTPIIQFRGVLDGANLTISGLNVANYFISDNYGTIKNIQFNSLTVGGTGQWTGLVRANRGTITDISVSNGSVSSSNSGGSSAVGGIVGFNSAGSSISRVSFQGTVYSESAASIGGIVGYNEGFSSLNMGSISNVNLKAGSLIEGFQTSAQAQSVGGIVGSNLGTVSNVQTELNTTIRYGDNSGGIVGYMGFSDYHAIVSATNNSNVSSGKNSGKAGGILGLGNGGILNKVRNNGQIGSSLYRGGIVGYGQSDITNCLNTGGVAADGIRGGIAGLIGNSGFIQKCINVGVVGGTNTSPLNSAGALAGENQGAINDSYYASETTNPGVGVGVGTSTGFSAVNNTALTDANTFTNWDFTTIWEIIAIHPTLR